MGRWIGAMSDKPLKSIEQIFKEDGRYPLEAVEFVREGLGYTIENIHPDSGFGSSDADRHVSGSQLCYGLRNMAQKRWGFLARKVLERWNIITTRDFGEIIFLLVDNNWMQKQPHDSIEDFEGVYDFREAFDQQFEIDLDQQS
jgi:uncharacterized repeat protein (TIGR04138 family)